eukprot:TRINITY_DN275_c0_g2_i1.p1 TRINITY_DN275_c0_g2~~TRINITY_DN275_c0_g2_i1.p1  ORF type:complete len:946 (+),score=98.92 TRINITY_DN275_c0_g2_i1:116-2953(+)
MRDLPPGTAGFMLRVCNNLFTLALLHLCEAWRSKSHRLVSDDDAVFLKPAPPSLLQQLQRNVSDSQVVLDDLIHDPGGCVGLGTIKEEACSVDEFLSLTSRIAVRLYCYIHRTNNVLNLVAAQFALAEQESLVSSNSPLPNVSTISSCVPSECNANVCPRYHYTSYMGEPILFDDPSVDLKDEARVNRGLRYAGILAGIENFTALEHTLFTPLVHTRFRYHGADPSLTTLLWKSGSGKDKKWNPCTVVDKQSYSQLPRLFEEASSAKKNEIVRWSFGMTAIENDIQITKVIRPVFTNTNTRMGALIMDVNLSHLISFLQNSPVGKKAYAAIVNQEGEVAAMTKMARKIIFMDGLKVSDTWQTVQETRPCSSDELLDCGPILRWKLSLVDAENNSSYSGMKFTPLLKNIFDNTTNSFCLHRMGYSSIYVPREKGEHTVSYCILDDVQSWALLFFYPLSEFAETAQVDIDDHKLEGSVEKASSGEEDFETLSFTMTNVGRRNYPFMFRHSVDGEYNKACIKVTAQPHQNASGVEDDVDSEVLAVGESQQVDVVFNVSCLNYGVTSGYVVVDADRSKMDGTCFQKSMNVMFQMEIQKPSSFIQRLFHEHGVKIFILLILLICVLLQRAISFCLNRHYQAIAKERKIVDDALDSIYTVAHPMVVLPIPIFRKFNQLIAHEDIIDSAKWLHTIEDIDEFLVEHRVIFMSHQWTAFSVPDPSGEQYHQMILAIDTITAEREWSESQTYVWVDYSSIPQRNRSLQTLAINSLTVYAAKVSAFVVVAPHIIHSDLGEACDVETYQRRAWCRAEQLSHLLSQSDQNMFLAADGSLTSLTDEFLEPSKHVFHGDLTCCRRKHVGMEMCDKERLVVPMLGLWAQLLSNLQKNNGNCRFSQLHADLSDRLDEVFPQSFEFESVRGKNRRPLFSRLVDRLEDRLQQSDPGEEEHEQAH